MTFDSGEQLKKFILGKCVKAVDNVKEKVHVEFAGNLNQFYSEFSPDYYIRTGALFNSLDYTDAVSTGNGASAEVYFETPSYKNGRVPLQNGGYGHAYWSGEQVLNVAMQGSHGGYVDGTAIWEESMDSLGWRQGIEGMLEQELKRQGL
jgi:hypothetical protein